LLLAAKTTGILPAVAPEIEKLFQAGFRASEGLVARILAEAGE
jgi:predicted nucleic acid-binding protein